MAFLGAVGWLGMTWGTWIAIAITVVSAISSNHQRIKAERKARDDYNASLEDRLVMTDTANGARSRVYGRV